MTGHNRIPTDGSSMSDRFIDAAHMLVLEVVAYTFLFLLLVRK